MHSTETRIFHYDKPFRLESGASVPGFSLAYTTMGHIDADRNNVVWIFHALTANSVPSEWWPGLVGEGKFFDPGKYFVVCVNMPGSCYGSTGPLSVNPETGHLWYHDFPFFTPRDMIRAYSLLKEAQGISKIHIGIGGSMGGQQLLEWAIEDPSLFEYIFPIATNAVHSAWGRAFNSSQRMCIETDATWPEKQDRAGIEGMKVARSVALISYRHYNTYKATQQDETDALQDFRSESYQHYQGDKLAARFNAFSYHALSKGMDAHNVGRNRGSIPEALQRISAKTLAIGLHSDILFPLEEQELIASHIPGASLAAIDSLFGHDGFLLEYEKLSALIGAFISLKKVPLHS